MQGRQLVPVITLAAGVYAIIRAFRGKEFFLTGIGGNRGNRPLPNWIGRPLTILFGVRSVVLAIGLWFQK